MGETAKRVLSFCVIYYFMVVIFSVEVFTGEINQSIAIIDQVLLILLLCIYPVFYFLIFKGSKKKPGSG